MPWNSEPLAVSATTDTAVVTVTGDLDLSSRQAAARVTEFVGSMDVPNVLIDVRNMGFMDSTGAAIVIGLAYQCRCDGGSAFLRGASQRDLFVLDVRGGLDLFEVDGTGTAAPGDSTPASGH